MKITSLQKVRRARGFGKEGYVTSNQIPTVFPLLNAAATAFISKIKTGENDIMCQFKTIRYFLNHAVCSY